MAARKIIKTVASKPAGPFHRLVGSVDCKGKGTLHELEHVDPIVLLDDGGKHIGKGLPPFGIHPHSGLIAITFIVEGAMSDMDNLNGESKELNGAGDIYAVSSGLGVAHMEKTASDGANRAFQTIVKIPDDKLHFPPEHSKIKEADLPVLTLPGGFFRIGVGKLGGLESPAKLKALPRFVLGRVNVNPGAKLELPLDEDLEQGVVYVIDGEGAVPGSNGQDVSITQGKAVYVFGNGGPLSITNQSSDKILDMYLAAGKPLNEPWAKLLGFNGFVIGKDEADVDRIMAKIGEVGVENFNYKVW